MKADSALYEKYGNTSVRKNLFDKKFFGIHPKTLITCPNALYVVYFTCLLTLYGTAWGQAVNDYQTFQDGNWNDVNTWSRWDGSSWVNPAPSTPTNAVGAITILNTHDVIVTANVSTDQTTINSGGSIMVNSGITLTIANGTGTDLTVNGTINNQGTITYTGTMAVGAGGIFNHDVNSVTLPATTTTWDNTSTININGITTNGTLTNVSGRTFGNFVYNSSATVTVNASFTVAGNLTFSAGTFNSSSSTTNYIITLGGALTFDGGSFVGSTSTATHTTANINLTNTGINTGGITFNSGSFSNANINVASGRTVDLLSNFTINNNTGTRTFTVASGGILNLGTNVINGTGAFTLASGGTIQIGSPQGVVLAAGGAFGNVQTSTRTYSAGGNYIYTGTNGQVTGAGCPANVTGSITVNLTNSSDQITITNAAAIGSGGTLRMVRGQLANQITYNATGKLEYAGTTGAQTTTNNEFPATSGPGTLIINNANGVTLHSSRTVTATTAALTLTDGILNTTTNSCIITVSGTGTSAVSGGSATSYVQGILQRGIASSASQTYSFPVGKSAYQNIDFYTLVAPGNTMVLQAEVFDAAPAGGTVGDNLSTIGNKYWELTKISGSGNIATNGGRVTLTDTGITTDSRVGYRNSVSGAYANIGGTVGANTLQSVISFGGTPAYFVIGDAATLTGTIQVGNSQPFYKNLTSVANGLRIAKIGSNVIFEFDNTYSSATETFPVVFNAFTEANGGPFNVTIRPASGATLLTSGDPGSAATLIDLDGANRISFDGRAGGTGTNRNWTFRNTRAATTYGPTFRLINDASNNTLTYLNIEGQNITSSSGTILFSTTTGTTGNDDNTISYCHIRDRSDATGTPAVAIFSLGTSLKTNSGNSILHNEIYNYYSATSSSTHSGVFISTNNSDWTITGNSFYQTTNRSNVTGMSHYVININNTGVNFVVKDNYIGGTQATAGGSKYTFTGTGSGTMTAIYFNPNSSATGCSIENNVITNISFSHGTSASTVAFVGIRNANGNTLIKNNTIGSVTATNKIDVTENYATTASASQGIYLDAGNTKIEGNKIGGFTLLGATASVSHQFYGILILSGSSGSDSIINNIIGSDTVANSIHASSNSTHANGQIMAGIWIGSTAGQAISGNIIANMTNTYSGTSTSGYLSGIYTDSRATGAMDFSNNSIYNLTNYSGSAGTNALASLSGIVMQRTAAGQTVSGNIIHSLNNMSSGSIQVLGIYYNGPTSGTNLIEGNFIHSLNAATSSTSATITGLHINAGNSDIQNNMISVGTGISTGFYIYGIKEAAGTNDYFFNSIYLGGTNVTPVQKNYAFYSASSSTSTRSILNNIFFSERSATNGTGYFYAIQIPNVTNLTSDHNDLYVTGVGSVLGFYSSDRPDFNAWQTGTGKDAASISYNPNFVLPDGTATTVDLHIKPSPATTPIEGVGINVATVTTDFDGHTRSGLTPEDIGADAGNFDAIDITPPTFSYTNIPGESACSGSVITTVQVTVNDVQSGVSPTANKPRMYFRRSVGGAPGDTWSNSQFVEGIYQSGTVNSSIWSFSLDYSAFGITPFSGNQFEYYFVAQDLAPTPNIGYSQSNGATPVHLDVASPSAFPNFSFGATGTFSFLTPLAGTVNVGSGQTYTTLTAAGGLFAAINANGLSDNLTVYITSNITENGANALNQWAEYCGSGYTVAIVPADNITVKTLSGSVAGSLITLDGADRVNIDGRYNQSGTTKYLRFANSNTGSTSSVITLKNDATQNTIQYCTLEGAFTATSIGIITIASSGTSGNSNNIIDNNKIGLAGTRVGNAIYATGTNNGNNVITNNEIFNFSRGGVYITGGTGPNWNISNNIIYDGIGTCSSYQMPIYLDGRSTSYSNVISGNSIGGTSNTNSGTWQNSAYNFWGILAFAGGTSITNGQTIIKSNTVKNIRMTNLGSANDVDFRAIYTGAFSLLLNATGAHGYYVIGGDNDADGNVIGDPANYASIQCDDIYGNGVYSNPSFYGIANESQDEVVIKNNKVYSLYTPGNWEVTYGIASGVSIQSSQYNGLYVYCGKTTISNNTVTNLRSYSVFRYNYYIQGSLVGISLLTQDNNCVVDHNTVYGLSSLQNNGTYQTAVVGIGIDALASGLGGGTVSNNIVYDILNTNGGTGTSNFAIGISNGKSILYFGDGACGSFTFSNNMVNLSSNVSTTGNDLNVWGILDMTETPTTQKYFNNTVLVGGSNVSSGTNTSSAFMVFPGWGIGTGTPNITVKNNIFVNNRTGGTGKHRAILNFYGSWGGGSCNYNFYANGVTANMGYWNLNTYPFALAGANNDWKELSGGDANSLYAQTTTGTSNYTTDPTTATVNPAAGKLFEDPSDIVTSGKFLHISLTDAVSYQFVSNIGADLSSAGITTDFDGDSRSSSPDLGADEFGGCSAPTLTATAGGVSTSNTACSGSSFNLDAGSSGGSGCSGSFVYAWTDGANYWNGSTSDFSSSSAIYDASYSTISTATTANKTYTVSAQCSSDASCTSSSNVAVSVLSAPAMVSAAIGTPANGLQHHMDVSWSAVSGATAYDLDYSNDGSSWTSLATNVSGTTYDHNTGDNPNVPLYYRVRAKDSNATCSWTAMSTPVYTAADDPAAPTVNGATGTTLNVTLQTETPVVNPAITTYSIYEQNTGLYVQANGSLGATEVFQTMATWGTETVTGLAQNTQYCFYAKAKNNDGDIRTANQTACGTTISVSGTIWTADAFTQDWFTSGNWSNGVPNASLDAIIPSKASTHNLSPRVEGATGGVVAQTKDLTMQAGAELDVSVVNNVILEINGAFSNSGLAPLGAGKIVMKGSSISGINAFGSLEIDNGGSAISLTSATSISGILSVLTGNSLTTNNNLTLLSGATLLHGTGTPNGGGTVTGNVKVLRASHSAPASYNFWSTPVQTANVSLLGNNRYYYKPSKATDNTEQGMRTGWVAASGNMTIGKGYISTNGGTVSFNGIANNANTGTPITISIEKNVGTTNQVPYNLVGNPFPGSLNAALFTAANSSVIGGEVYLWDDDASGGSGWSTAQDYVTWNNTGTVSGTNSGTNFNGHIASGQGFFVRKLNDGNATVQFQNAMRSTENDKFFRQAPIERVWVSVTNTANKYNEVLIGFIDDATDGEDWGYDAPKLKGSELSMYTKLNGENYAIQGLPILVDDKTVQVGLDITNGGVHTIKLKTIENLDETMVVLLEDTKSGVFQNLRVNDTYTFTEAAGLNIGRFNLHFNPALKITANDESCTGGDGQIVLDQKGTKKWNYILTDAQGNLVQSATGYSGTVSINTLPQGTYTLSLVDEYGYQTAKTIEVGAKQRITADFNVAPLTTPGDPVVFNNFSTGASVYEWNFGDGSPFEYAQNPIHVYADPGQYTVTLQAANDDCSEMFSRVVTIKFGLATGINENEKDRVYVYSWDKNIYVKFDYEREVPARIIIFNAVGQEKVNASTNTSGIYKIEMDGPAQMYLIKIMADGKVHTAKTIVDMR